ncbi:non-hydrolyzing UDP-N-acetylglucosamine 2-epimerase [Clostridium tagluense]|uniref:non-hydrolyzing UDP-N-acetylglucosamine 2-epimerase n=1 Tax=Clostridium tagluense TaxID=360422 RepID=UPI001CF33943|nr:UDP-N-acetylglucosamine 2-epimerase (non-hydrolyzing) [Clostridium tagluense]MCB2299651.1 UDP-N-acetylglucosamine 2-epimerase (non-hydrolyzing) [Clostridium tagluense]
MKILTVIGARPQFVKASMVSNALRKNNNEIIIHTGQHYDDNMSKVFFEELDIPKPDYNLNICSGNHGYQTGNMLIKIESVLQKEKPDCVLVYGDTNSTLAGALASSKMLIPLIHIEAGLRSYNMTMPEEQNRILTDHISNILFAPTKTAVSNLSKEGIVKNVYNVGDVMYDSILHFNKIAEKKTNIMNILNLNKEEYILATIHRAENTNDFNRLKNIVEALNESEEKIILPLHPRTQKYISEYGLYFEKNVQTIQSVGYLEMVMLEKNCKKIVTDSGGVQKEAFFLDKPCITLREETEWIETVENGWNILVGADKLKIKDAILQFKCNEPKNGYFGFGDAVKKIVDIIG